MANASPIASITSGVRAAYEQLLAILFTPKDLPGCIVWLRPTLGLGKTGTLLASWTDQAQGRVLTAPSVVERPSLVDSSAPLNGRAAIRFAGVGEVLIQQDAPALPFEKEPFSAFALVSPATIGLEHGWPLAWFGKDGSAHAGLEVDGSGVFQAWLETHLTSGITLMPNKPTLVGLVYDGDEASLYVNGKLVVSVPGLALYVEPGPSPRLVVGGQTGVSFPFHGDLGDVAVFDRALAPAEITTLATMLMRYYRMKDGTPKWLDGLEGLIGKLGGWARSLGRLFDSAIERLAGR